MADQIRHRGPDGKGVWTDAEAGIGLGHRRLAVLELSDAGRQPMASASGRWIVVFNGEIYNHLEIRREIEQGSLHDRWRGHSDTETLVEAIETWGFQQALTKLVGMFAIAAWDRKERCLWLARDRMGEKPLYYGWVEGSFVFASELRAIRAFSRGRGLSVSTTALSLLASLNYIPAPRSIYREIDKLLPGSVLRVPTFADQAIHPQSYWDFPASQANTDFTNFDGATHVERVDAALRQAVSSQMLSDVPLGALLSGGIDSSLIVAIMQTVASSRVKTFTIGFEDASSDESSHARKIAGFLGTDHHEMLVTPATALEQIPNLPAMLDEPMGDSSQIPTMCVMQLARQHVTVALSGDGADELFGGYGRYRSIPKSWGMINRVPRSVRRLGEKLIENGLWDRVASLGGGKGPASLRAARYYLPRMARARTSKELYVGMLMQWTDSEVVLGNGLGACAAVLDVLGRASSDDLVPFMMEADALTYLPDDVLVKVDRAAMACSLETRAPFLDMHLVELASQIPLASKLDAGRGKVVLRECLAKYIPRELFERPKHGFSVPIDAWLRGPLRDWADGLLSMDRIRREGHFDPAVIAHAWERHLAGRSNNGHQLWSILMFQAWLDNIQSEPGQPGMVDSSW
jgi:asparagine synthase (glutamine-hydrolysing)